ncbi:hypothetical protein MHU86_18250 [Fragilaria crotonensis]|nr:hypothetical protein MHU86_18250 [Fragilaria crotonensis]
MSFRGSSTPSDGRRGVDHDDAGINHQQTPPSRDDADDSFVEQVRAYSPISFISEDDGTKPLPVPKRHNVPEKLGRMVSFGSVKLSEPSATVRVVNDSDDESSGRHGSPCAHPQRQRMHQTWCFLPQKGL